MLDFSKLKFGAIQHEDGLVIVTNGIFHGPFNQREMVEVMKIFKTEQGRRKGNCDEAGETTNTPTKAGDQGSRIDC
ncbi:hypothetical protein [Paenibacillus sp. FSL L8-0708]|uniref:hypothetical protein n=1 Tax=Paenibacillus sp. FSL L8-0708 TaxID=2975311 RepID=UPI0030FAD38A